MLLTIHNLPPNTGYTDVKALLQKNCGLTELILDNLVNEGCNKKVTVGLAEEGDAAILVRKINGLFVNGDQLYVEDVRQKKASEQPYRRGSTTKPQDQPIKIGGYTPQFQQGYSTMPSQFNYPMANAYSGSGQAQQSANPYQETPMSYMMSNPMMGQMAMGGMGMGGMGYYMPQMQNNYMDYGMQSQDAPDDSNYSTYSDQQVQNVEPLIKSNENRKGPELYPHGNKGQTATNRQHSNAKADYMSKSPTNERTNERMNRSSRWDRDDKGINHGKQHRSRSPNRNEDYRENQNRYESYYVPQPSGSVPYYKQEVEQRESSRNNPRENRDSGYGPPEPYGLPEPQNRFRGRANERNDQRRYNSDNEYNRNQQQGSNTSRQSGWSYNNAPSPQRTNAPKKNWEDRRNQVDIKPQSIKRDWGNNGHQTRVETKPQPKFYDRKPDANKLRSQISWSNRETASFENKPQPRVNRKNYDLAPNVSNAQQHKSGNSNRPAPSDNWRQKTDSQLPRDKPPKQKKVTLQAIINRDTSWRFQVAAQMGKEIITNHKVPDDLDEKYALKQLKAAIHSRILLLLQNEMGVAEDDIIARYRQKFPKTEDNKLFDAVINKIIEEGLPRAFKTHDSTTEEKVKVTDTKPPLPLNEIKPVAATAPKPVPKPAPKAPKPAPKTAQSAQLPKYPQGDKKVYNSRKQQERMEFEAEDNYYPLEPAIRDALAKEVADICDVYENELLDPEDEKEKIVCDRIKGEPLNDFRKVLKVRVAKRILDIRTHLTLRVYISRKIPKMAELRELLAKYGVISLKKSDTKKAFYIANCATYKDYDSLCASQFIRLPDTTLRFNPLHLTGPPRKVTKEKIATNRKKFIASQIDNTWKGKTEDNDFADDDECIKIEDDSHDEQEQLYYEDKKGEDMKLLQSEYFEDKKDEDFDQFDSGNIKEDDYEDY